MPSRHHRFINSYRTQSEEPTKNDPHSPFWGTIGYAVLSAMAVAMVFYLTFAQ